MCIYLLNTYLIWVNAPILTKCHACSIKWGEYILFVLTRDDIYIYIYR